MHDLVYELKQLGWRNKDGANATWADRRALLQLCGEQLVTLGYKHMHVEDLGGRHVQALVKLWKGEGLSPGTLANRLATLRYWAEKVRRPYVVAKTNAAYGIAARVRVSVESKGKTLPEEALAQVQDPHIQMSLRLIQAYGIRRKESLLVRPHACDQGDHLVLMGSMTKNGRPRQIPLTTLLQRETLDAAKRLIPTRTGSLIPAGKSFIQQRRVFDYWVRRIGLGGAHSLRHTWAEERYAVLSGMVCPHRGGLRWHDMTDTQREADLAAREIIASELGHGRLQVVDVYIGRNV